MFNGLNKTFDIKKVVSSVLTTYLIMACAPSMLGQLPDVNTRMQMAALRSPVSVHFDEQVLRDSLLAGELQKGGSRQVALPSIDGEKRTYTAVETQTMHQSLAARYPQIRTFRLTGAEGSRGQLTVSPSFTRAQMIEGGRAWWFEPVRGGQPDEYVIHRGEIGGWECQSISEAATAAISQVGNAVLEETSTPIPAAESLVVNAAAANVCDVPPQANINYPFSSQLRTYDLAVTTTVPFTTANGGSIESTLAAIATLVADVNIITEQDLGIRFQLVEDNDKLISVITGDTFDSFVIQEGLQDIVVANAAFISEKIGNDYDIGHILNVNPDQAILVSGSGKVGSICTPERAFGQTISQSGIPSERFARIFAHELGHQLGADHTWTGGSTFNNGSVSDFGGCISGNFAGDADVAMEPGSGTTIMSYAGICGFQNIDNIQLPQYHIASIQQINAVSVFSNDACGCGTGVLLDNVSPKFEGAFESPVGVVDQFNQGTPEVFVPLQTPFELSLQAIDADGDDLLYSWEQFDNFPINISILNDDVGGVVDNSGNFTQAIPITSDGIENPVEAGSAEVLFADFVPTVGNFGAPIFPVRPLSFFPTRSFPSQLSLFNNGTKQGTGPVEPSIQEYGEKLPAAERSMRFLAVARDGNGSVGTRLSLIRFVDTGSPFTVEEIAAEDGPISGPFVVEWDTAGTQSDPFNVSTVDISIVPLVIIDGVEVSNPLDIAASQGQGTDGDQFPGGIVQLFDPIQTLDGVRVPSENPIVIASGLPNTGEAVVVPPPGIVIDRARIRVSGVQQPFFSVTRTDIAVDTVSAPGCLFAGVADPVDSLDVRDLVVMINISLGLEDTAGVVLLPEGAGVDIFTLKSVVSAIADSACSP